MAKTLTDLMSAIDKHHADDASTKIDVEICLEGHLITELDELERQRIAGIDRPASGTLADGGQVITSTELDGKIKEIKQQISESILTLHFEAVSDTRYRQIMNHHPDVGTVSGQLDFQAELAEECYQGSSWQGVEATRADLPLTTLQQKCRTGDLQRAYVEVTALNVRMLSRDF